MANTLTGTHEIDHGDGSRTFVAEAVDSNDIIHTRSTTLYDNECDSTRADKIAATIRDAEND